MTDVHSHILFGIDDGAKDINESIELLEKMKNIGFNNVILTPHYIERTDYNCNNNNKSKIINTLKQELKKRNIDINIYLGNEIFINENIYKLIQEKEIHKLNNTEYILVELPFSNKISNFEDIIYELKLKGLIPIIAHPERYIYFQNNYKEVDRLRKEGFLFQGNYSSILGYYGKESEKLIKYMLKNKYIDYLGTDIHSINKTFVIDNFNKIEKAIIKIAKLDYYKKIINNNNNIANNT